MKIKTIQETKTLKNKRVLLRSDFDVPLLVRRRGGKTRHGKIQIADDFKIKAALPTIKYLQNKGAITIIASYLGRPHGKKKKELSLFPVAESLSLKLNQDIIFVEDCLSPSFAQAVDLLEPGEIVLLENLRFYPEEEKNSPLFAKKLARLGDIYINDAFAGSHRHHASMVSVPKYLQTYAGLNLAREVEELTEIMEHHQHPCLAVIGGAKIETKLPVIEKLAQKFDLVVVGGATANNFIKALGYEVGKSLVEKKYVNQALKLLNNKKLAKKIIIPLDARVSTSLESPRKSTWRRLDQIKKDEYILDIGPRTQHLYSKLIRHSKMVVWNGPMGLYENKHFRRGSYAIARTVASRHPKSIVGGGETLDILKRLRLTRKISFVSTGGGAMLEFLEGKILPGIKPLIKK